MVDVCASQPPYRLSQLSRRASELFGLSIPEGAVANIFRRTGQHMAAAARAITAKLLQAKVVASDEATTRTNGVTHWQGTFISSRAVLHTIAARRSRSVAEGVLGGHQPGVWVSDRYAGQQELGKAHQVCLAPVLRDVQYAMCDTRPIAACRPPTPSPSGQSGLRWCFATSPTASGQTGTLKSTPDTAPSPAPPD